MDLGSLAVSATVLGGVGLFFGTLIALANRKLKVWEDPRIDGVEELLPGTNCGACGCPGCHAFAEALVDGEVVPSGCTVMGSDDVDVVADYLGVDAGDSVKRVARLLCAGGVDVAVQQAHYRGHPSCQAAASIAGGGKGCSWGCLGLADCADVCDFDAIEMNAFGLPVVDLAKCTACNDCVVVCPKDLFVLMPVTQKLIVQCKNALEGDEAEILCRVACTACKKCALDAEPGVIEIVDGLAVIDYRENHRANADATKRCPTDAIIWLEGRQFQSERRSAERLAR